MSEYPWEQDPDSVRLAKRKVEDHLMSLDEDTRRKFIDAGMRTTAAFLAEAQKTNTESALKELEKAHSMAPAIVLYFIDTIHTLGGLGEFTHKATRHLRAI